MSRSQLQALILFAVLPLFCAGQSTHAKYQCDFGGEKAASDLEYHLEQAKSCSSAAKLFESCRWGSSADSGFGAIVVQKCEKAFYSQLSPVRLQNYLTEMQLCSYEFARQQGTMYISEAASCQVGIAEKFATDPKFGTFPPPRASFDCTRAQSPLEIAICSDIRLGRADIVLSRTYKSNLGFLKPLADKQALIADERKWLISLPASCDLTDKTPSTASVACLRHAFELRFTAIDTCYGGGSEESPGCLEERESEEVQPTDPDSNQRASFDCESPKTAVELVVCANAALGQLDIALASVYQRTQATTDPAQQDELAKSEADWQHFVESACPMGVVGGIPSILTRSCVRSAYEFRISQLDQCTQNALPDRIPCLNKFAILSSEPGSAAH